MARLKKLLAPVRADDAAVSELRLNNTGLCDKNMTQVAAALPRMLNTKGGSRLFVIYIQIIHCVF